MLRRSVSLIHQGVGCWAFVQSLVELRFGCVMCVVMCGIILVEAQHKIELRQRLLLLQGIRDVTGNTIYLRVLIPIYGIKDAKVL